MSKNLEQRFQRFCRTGDTRALADVFDATAAVLGRVAGHLSPNQAAAEDLLQETFVAAIESAGRFDPERPLMPWLLGLMSHQARRARRQDLRRPDTSRLEAGAVMRPENEAMEGEFQQAVGQAISSLPEPYREVLALHLQEEEPAVQVARRLGRSDSTIRTQIQRGLDLLRKGLPAGFAPAILPLASLDRIRESVLEEALAEAMPAAAAGPGGSAAVSVRSLAGVKVGFAVLAAAVVAIGGWQLVVAGGSHASEAVLDPVVLTQEEEEATGPTGLEKKPAAVDPDPDRKLWAASPDEGLSNKIGDLEFFPVQVPDGPLLFSIGSSEETGSRERVHYLQGPASRSDAQIFLRCQHNVRIVSRLDRGRILIKNHGDPYGLMVLDLPTAQVTQLQHMTNNEILAVQDDKVLFLVKVVGSGFGFRTEDLPAPEGSTFLWSWDRSGKSPARRIFDRPVKAHWVMHDGSIVVLQATGDSRLWRIDPHGIAHKELLKIGLGAHPHRVQLSPGGTRLAIGTSSMDAKPISPSMSTGTRPSRERTDPGDSLLIYEVATGKQIRRIANISCDVSMASSFMPRVEFVWLDDRRIRYSESFRASRNVKTSDQDKTGSGQGRWESPAFRFVDVDVESGKRLAAVPYSKGGLYHEVPPLGKILQPDEQARRERGWFDEVGTKTYYRGAGQALIDTAKQWDWPRFSPDGRFFVVTRSKPVWKGLIYDGKTRTQQDVGGWRSEFRWLPTADR